MKTVVRLEAIADNLYEYERLRRAGRVTRSLPWRTQLDVIRFARRDLRPWLARVRSIDAAGRVDREFVRYQTKDYSQANSQGSRGVYLYYTLSDGLYEVNERTSWTRARRYFLRVENGKSSEISREEAVRCLSASASASTS